MLIFRKTSELEHFRTSPFFVGKIIGFVPTMGALHEGHASLVRQARKQCDTAICSIFVNPTQFNDPKDLHDYPRTIEQDLNLLASLGCDIVFLPVQEEVYPADLDTRLDIDFGNLISVMEGKFRPGHFDGVAQVVKRLLDIVRPQVLYLGQKDFQQVVVIRHMIEKQLLGVDIRMCETIREVDGLAMSSRNLLLRPEIREKAGIIHKTLKEAKERFKNGEDPQVIKDLAVKSLEIPDFRIEYFEIVDGDSLTHEGLSADSRIVVACTAVWAGNVRLIDNMILR